MELVLVGMLLSIKAPFSALDCPRYANHAPEASKVDTRAREKLRNKSAECRTCRGCSGLLIVDVERNRVTWLDDDR